MRLPFDAHNHVHMGPSPPSSALSSGLDGMAIMSTHPRDFETVTDLTHTLPQQFPGVQIVPCFGIHPWFIGELEEPGDTGTPAWLQQLEERLASVPGSIVGEIGLDGFRFAPDTGELVTPMDRQVQIFEAQMTLAARLQRPVSIHTVQCFGPLLQSLAKVKTKPLPPKLYFHAFGGKPGTIDQLLAACGDRHPNPAPPRVYFGFSPVVNFRSPKTPDVIRKVGLERLVLETDREDAAGVPGSMETGIQKIAKILGVTEQELIDTTTQNARDLYGLA